MKSVHQSHAEFHVYLNLRNYIESHSIILQHHNRSGKQMYATIMKLLKEATESESVRDAITDGTYVWTAPPRKQKKQRKVDGAPLPCQLDIMDELEKPNGENV